MPLGTVRVTLAAGQVKPLAVGVSRATIRKLAAARAFSIEATVVFRTEEGKKLDAAVRGRFVAFEVDTVDPEWRRGWSVVIRGWAEEVTDPDELEQVRARPLTSWAPGTRGHYVRIRPEVISGRRIG